MTPKQKNLIGKLAAMATREHHDCTDIRFTACAKHPLGKHLPECSADCDCGADEHNAAVKAIAAELLAEPPASESGRTIKIRFPIALNERGQYVAYGCSQHSHADESEEAMYSLGFICDVTGVATHIQWINTEVPLPECDGPDIEAKVEG